MFTANSMNTLMEAMGIALPGNGTILALTKEREELYKQAAAKGHPNAEQRAQDLTRVMDDRAKQAEAELFNLIAKEANDEVKKKREKPRTRTDKQSFLLRAFPSYDFGQSSNTSPLSYSNRSIAVRYGTVQ